MGIKGVVVAVIGSFVLSSAVQAQDNPELGVVEAEQQSQGTWQPPTGQVDNSAPATSAPPADDADDFGSDAAAAEPGADDGSLSDHQKMVGHFGVGFFGTVSVPVMGCVAPAGCPTYDDTLSVLAPTLGARYWWKRRIGFEAALGFHHSGGDTEVVVDNGTTSVTTLVAGPTVTAFALHLGVPFALADGGHFTFQVIPEMNVGFSTGSYEGPTAAEDWDIKGSMFELGGRIGAELHFGFIGVPQLSLQASVGLFLRHASRSAEQAGDLNAAVPIPNTTIDQSRTEFRTTLEGEPWDIFTGGITAIYYL